MISGLKKSLALHLAVFLLWVIDVPMFWWNRPSIGQAPIIVDLKDVKISEMTNLPPKAKFGKEDKAASTVKRKIEKNYTKEEAKPAPEPEPKPQKASEPESKAEEKAQSEPPKKDFLAPPQPKKPKVKPQPQKPKPPAPKPAAKKQPEPKKQAPKKAEDKAPQLANPLKSLLASVDALEKAEVKSETATIKEGTEVANMGVEGGVGGSYFSELSISEMDALAGQLRACWNLDPGAMGIEDMIVEIRAELSQDGKPMKVEVKDQGRYRSDSHFRSVADSAVRAVYICAPYKILSENYAEKYDEWRVLRLRFNPIDKSVQ